MVLANFFEDVGKYVLLMKKVLSFPQKWSTAFRQYINEVQKLGFDSIGIVIIISFFIGAVIVVQIALNMDNGFLPRYTVGFVSREIIVLEFSSSIMSLILAGKVGSNIASEIGTMRVTEQIDALEIMGVNSANYLILPKIVALMTFIPILVVLSMVLGLLGGYFVCHFTHIVPVADFEYGIQSFFKPFYVWYSIIKSICFGAIISSVSAFFGYYVEGGSLEVGKASTNAVVISSVLILISDLVLTNLMMQ
ncbi:MAG: transporter permease [Bacteroidetes bacterium]|jgi:phospholipid/cholesterol/gamma-HCH transport system permease protein|nr:transporter permease [Bacteroidota bacterium]